MSVSTGRMIERKVVNARYASIVPSDGKDKPMPASTILLTSHELRRAADAVFRPGREIFFEERGEWFANLWQGFGASPKAGDRSVWVDHVKWICNDNEIEYNRVFDFFAAIVQRPAEKIRRMILVVGKPGIGKDISIEPIKMIVGRMNFRTARKDSLMSRFNGWAERAIFVVCSEFKLNSEDEFERIKELCTNDDIDVESKGRDQKQALNYANLMAFSNHDVACMLPADDRRIDVIKSFVTAAEKVAVDPQYYSRLRGFCTSEAGVPASCSGCWTAICRDSIPVLLRRCPRPRPRWGASQIHEHDAWLDMQLSEERAPFLTDVVSVHDILAEMRANKEITNVKRIAIWLKARGHRNLGQRSVNGSRPTLWAVRDHNFFDTAQDVQIRNAYMGISVRQETAVILDKLAC
jgi:hypothetical protein